MSASADPQSIWWKDARLWSWIILVGILLSVAGIRYRLRDMPLERDEGEYAYSGQLLLEGASPLRLAYTMKFPGTSGAYAVLMAFFGQSCAGVHLGLLVVNAGSMVLVFLLARRLLGDTAARVAAATYSLMSLSGDVLGTAGHATHFVVLPALGGLLLLWRASESGKPGWYFGSGLLLGLAVLMKQNGAFFATFGSFWLAWVGCARRTVFTKPFIKTCAAFFSGMLLPFLILLLLLWRAGSLERFWFWTFEYARTYGPFNPGWEQIWRRIMQRMPEVEQPAYYAALLGLAALWCQRDRWPVALFATGWLLCSVAAVVPGFHFRSHYFVLLAPILAFLTGAAVQQAARWLGGLRFKFLAALPLLTFAYLFFQGVARERKLFFDLSPLEVCRSLYGFQPFPEARLIADYIREHSPPDARIAVLGSEPEIYFYSHRRSATGYIYTYPFMERQPYAQQMRDEMRQEIEAAKPMFIVQVRTWTSWLARPGSPKRIDDLCDTLTPPDYELTGYGAVFPADSRVEWRWGAGASVFPTNAPINLLILQRKAPAGDLH